MPAVILTGRPLYTEELVVYLTVNLSSPSLRCAAHTAWPSGLCCAAHIPQPQDKLIIAEEIRGSSHLVLVIIPPACPCLYLKAQQEVLI